MPPPEPTPIAAARRLLIAEPMDFTPAAREMLATLGTIEQRDTTREELAAAFGEYDVIWVRLRHRIDAAVIGEHPRCRVLACAVTGLDHIDLAACEKHGIRVVSLRGETEFLQTVRATAELTLALVLALLRQLPMAVESVRDGVWQRDRYRGRELFGKTAGIVGMGRLGTITAGYFRAFGMRVLGVDPRPDFPAQAAERVADIGEMFAQSDVVSLHVNYTAETRHLIGAREFARIKPGAVLVNTSRGGIVDESALLAALETGTLAAAALDVLDGEPAITAAHPVVAFARAHPEKLLIVPHIGGSTYESFEKTETFIAGRIREALAAIDA